MVITNFRSEFQYFFFNIIGSMESSVDNFRLKLVYQKPGLFFTESKLLEFQLKRNL